jgi:hypothetical protein
MGDFIVVTGASQDSQTALLVAWWIVGPAPTALAWTAVAMHLGREI